MAAAWRRPASPPSRPTLKRRHTAGLAEALSREEPPRSSVTGPLPAKQIGFQPKNGCGPTMEKKRGGVKSFVEGGFLHGNIALRGAAFQKTFLPFCYMLGLAVSVHVFLWARSSYGEERRLHLETICTDRTRIMAGLFKKNTNHVQTFQALIVTLNRSAYENPPARFPVFAPGTPPCQLHIVPRVEEATVAEYLEETLHARPMVLRMGFGAFVPHHLRREFEECMGLTIIDWHTRKPSPPRPDYIVKTHGSNLTYLQGVDLSSISDQHVILWERAKEADGLVVSPPYVLVASKDQKMGVGVAFPNRPMEMGPNSSIEEKRSATTGCAGATIDFESMVEGVLADLQQGRIFDVIMRVDDVTDFRHPIPLYEPPSLNPMQREIKPPELLLSKTSYSAFVPDNWKFREDVEDDDIKSPKWLVTPLDLGDKGRIHEVRCRYKEEQYFPTIALIMALGALAIYLLLLQILIEAIRRFVQMKEDFVRMSSLKQAAEAGNTAKSTFLAAMTQEVRAPMREMLAMMDLLLKTPLDPVQLDYVRTAEASGRILIYLINDVLDYAMIESGHFELESMSFNLRSLIDEVLSLLSPMAQEKQGRVELAALVFDSVPTFAIGDPVRLRQILVNIVGNALKFTDLGHVLLTVRLSPEKPRPSWSTKKTGSSSSLDSMASNTTSMSASPSPSPPTSPFQSAEYLPGTIPPSYKGQGWEGLFHTLSGREAADASCSWEAVCRTVQFDEKRQLLKEKMDHEAVGSSLVPVRRRVKLDFNVEDTGIGIPENAKDRIYLPFAQLETGRKRGRTGVGVGLSLAQRLIDLMGGSIDFVSRPRIGTTFKFDIKLDVLDRPPGSLEQQRILEAMQLQPPGLAQLKGKKALVVDGQQVRQQVLASCLRQLGLQVELSDNIFSAAVAIQESIIYSSSKLENNGQLPYSGQIKVGWDVVLVDAEAGGLGTGIELGNLLIRACETRNIAQWERLLPKLILVACGLDEEEKAQLLRGPFTSTLMKPVRCTMLAACLAEVFGLNGSPSRAQISNPTNKQQLQTLVDIMRGKRMLVLDSSLATWKVVSEVAALLTAERNAAIHVKDCSDALARLQESDLVMCFLVDLDLLDVDGYETVKRIQALDRVPILGLYSETTSSFWLSGERAGIDLCLMKPLSEVALVEALIGVMVERGAMVLGSRVARSSSNLLSEHASLKGWLNQL